MYSNAFMLATSSKYANEKIRQKLKPLSPINMKKYKLCTYD